MCSIIISSPSDARVLRRLVEEDIEVDKEFIERDADAFKANGGYKEAVAHLEGLRALAARLARPVPPEGHAVFVTPWLADLLRSALDGYRFLLASEDRSERGAAYDVMLGSLLLLARVDARTNAAKVSGALTA